MNRIRLTPWKYAVSLPVITKSAIWSLKALERILTVSIRRCAKFAFSQDGAIATTLSGGLDSSLCLAKINELYGQRAKIFTFTIAGSFNHPDAKHARMASRKFGSIHTEIIPTQDELEDAEAYLNCSRALVNPGDVAVFLLYSRIARAKFTSVIAHDGIDELLGGYPDHRFTETMREKKTAFLGRWARLSGEHLMPLEETASQFCVQPVFPYLQSEVVRYISHIPLNKRTNREESKIPLREIARKYLPREIIERQKLGFCDALTETVNQAP